MTGRNALTMHYDPDGDGALLVDTAESMVGLHDRHQVAEPQVVQPVLVHRDLVEHLNVVVAATTPVRT